MAQCVCMDEFARARSRLYRRRSLFIDRWIDNFVKRDLQYLFFLFDTVTGNIDNWAKPRRFFSFRTDIFRAIVLVCTFQNLVVVTSEDGISNVFDNIIEDFGRNLTKCIEQ